MEDSAASVTVVLLDLALSHGRSNLGPPLLSVKRPPHRPRHRHASLFPAHRHQLTLTVLFKKNHIFRKFMHVQNRRAVLETRSISDPVAKPNPRRRCREHHHVQLVKILNLAIVNASRCPGLRI